MRTANTSAASVPLTERKYILPLVLITSLFFLWALGVNLNDVLIPHLKKAFRLTDLQSSLIQTAFFGGYFLAALPAGRLMERIGYKKGILTGLALCATGALLFIPAATILAYWFFLLALFVMACGQSFLEVAANPYVTVLGPAGSAERRLNLAQSFNSVGAVITPVIGAAFILTNTESQSAQMDEASTVRIPYLIIASIFLAVAAMICFTKLPEVQDDAPEPQKLSEVWKHPHLVRGVLAQFFYVGAQVGVASFIIRLTEYLVPGTADKAAAGYLKWHLLGFMIGRFAGSAIMKYIPASRLLAAFRGLSDLRYGGAGNHRSNSGLRGGADWLLPLDHVSDHLRAEYQRSRRIHQAGIVAAGDVDHWRSRSAGDHGICIGRHQHPARAHRAAGVLCLHSEFRRKEA